MIFVCVGSREYQFDRLLKKVDELIEQGDIKDYVFAQIGQSNYIPKYYSYRRFISVDEFQKYQSNADLIISHGGTGALIGALKVGKQVIAVPRLSKYGEHIDDHQTQISAILSEEGYLREVLDIQELGKMIKLSYSKPILKKYNKPSKIISIIDDYIQNVFFES